MKDRRGTPQETIQAESGLWGKLSFLGNIFCQALYVFFFLFFANLYGKRWWLLH